MKRYRLVVTGAARADLSRIVDYLAIESPEHADQTYEAIESAIATRVHLPEKFAPVGASRKRNLPIRRLIILPYLAFYRVEADTVFVLRVRHEKQKPLKRFD